RACNADGVDDELASPVVSNELASELGVSDAGVLGNGRTKSIDLALLLERGVELAKRPLVKWVSFLVAGKNATRLAFTDIRCPASDVEPPACGIRHHLVRIDRAHLPCVEVIDAPPLVAVLEGVLLAPPPAEDGDHLLRRKR